jgi:hypothetical protein
MSGDTVRIFIDVTREEIEEIAKYTIVRVQMKICAGKEMDTHDKLAGRIINASREYFSFDERGRAIRK